MGMSLPAAPKARFWRGLFVPILIGLGNKWRLLTSCNAIGKQISQYHEETTCNKLYHYIARGRPHSDYPTHTAGAKLECFLCAMISPHTRHLGAMSSRPPITFDLCSNPGFRYLLSHLWHFMILPMDDPQRSSKLFFQVFRPWVPIVSIPKPAWAAFITLVLGREVRSSCVL